jgi:predicted metal-dependent peptidase
MANDFAYNIARLLDPMKVAKNERQFATLQGKISDCMTRMFQKPGNGGNPFLFAWSGPRPHFLAKSLSDGRALETAATDGRCYMWNPDFLESLSKSQITTIMQHEASHTIFFHCTVERSFGKSPEDWNMATDFIVNAIIELSWKRASEEAHGLGKQLDPLWGDPIGMPVTLKEVLDWIDGITDYVGAPNKPHCYSDISLVERSPESVYAEIRQHRQNSPRCCKACNALSINPKTKKSIFGDPPYPINTCPMCGAPPGSNCLGGGFDTHIDPVLSKDQVMSAVMNAASVVKAMGRGNVPAEIEAALAELQQPTLLPHDIIVNALQRKALDVGANNDYTRFRRRPQFIYERDLNTGVFEPKHRLYKPKTYDHSAKWVALLDTSGSMSDADIANGLKELQAVAGMADSEGWVVPCDAETYWDKKTRITSVTDVKRTKIVGRGGTVFLSFFQKLPQEIGTDLDCVVIITDGDCGAHEIPLNLRPSCDCLWILTNRRPFEPSFGRVIQLDPVKH